VTQVQQRPPIQRQEPYRKIVHEYLDRKSKARRSRPSLGLHPNVPISILLSSDIDYRSSPETSSDTSIDIILTPTSSLTDHETSAPIQNTEMKVKYEKRVETDDTDRKYAERLEAEERHRRRQARKGFTEARRLSEKLAREEQVRLEEQRRYAKKLEREEKEYAEQVRLNKEAAEKAQARLEAEAKKRLDDRRRKEREGNTARAVVSNNNFEDRRRREREEITAAREIEGKKKPEDQRRREREEERKRMYLEHENALEKEKKVRFGREPLGKRLALSLYDEKRWRDAYNIQEDHKRKKELETKNRDSKPKKVDCVSCMEPGVKKEMAVLPCNHAYCGECITGTNPPEL
jgi:hypothetical protein